MALSWLTSDAKVEGLRIQLALSFDEDPGTGALTNHELDRPPAKSVYC